MEAKNETGKNPAGAQSSATGATLSGGLADPHKALIERALACYVANNEIDKYEESIIIGIKRKLGLVGG